MRSVPLLELKLLTFTCLAALLAASCERPRTEEERKPTGIAALLPSETELPEGWKIADSARVFTGRQLYEYINGGADLFFEYGFEEVAAGQYLTPDDRAVFINIHRMSDPVAAFGIFSVTRREEYRPVVIGTVGARTDYQQIFCHGSYYLEAQLMETDSLTQRGMEYLCRAVDKKLEAEPARLPEALGLLPAKDLTPDSRVLVRGPLGLNTRKYLSDENLFTLSDSVPGVLASGRMSANRGEPQTILVVNYPDSAIAESVFGNLKIFYQERAAREADRQKLQLQERKLVFPTRRGFDIIRVAGKMVTATFDSTGIPQE
jgi:hypothetical protein